MSRAWWRLLPLGAAAVLLVACGGSGATAAPTATAAIIIVGSPTPSAAATTLALTTSAASAANSTGGITTSAATTSAATTAAVTVSGTGKAGLRLRETPNGKEVQALPEGTVLSVLGDPQQQAGGYSWLHVRTAKGSEGWVATQYLTPAPSNLGAGGAVTATPGKTGQ